MSTYTSERPVVVPVPSTTTVGDNGYTIRQERLFSLDALRGFDMFWIIAGEGIFHALGKATGSQPFTTISEQLHHSKWHGFTFYDLIFPLFIFISGVSMPYSFAKCLSAEKGISRNSIKHQLYRSLLQRTVILMVLGMVVNGLLAWKGYDQTRFASVLGRIGLSCFFAALIYLNCSQKKQLVWFVVLLFGYWAAMTLFPVPGIGAGVLTPEGNLAAYIDRLLLPGRLHRVIYDPEGLLSTIPAVGTAMLGIFTGQFLRLQAIHFTSLKKGITLLGAGLALLLSGLLWNTVFPINKILWTSSFVLYAGGLSMLLFAVFYLLIDVAGYKKWSLPFVWIGMNAILIYIASHGMVNFMFTAEFLVGGLAKYAPQLWQPVILWSAVAFIQLALLYFLHKHRLFFKV
ncbi:DUF5009 domain-containing protein [Segetibacter sp. 3557_3]|uniref:acyltransferase family protein n=1 Tax=Segetibacter sp. 3557_3 TaxID=2547429 RepID=UPI0010591AF7|nr:DUF5009 domain-containing protein [Segetibacter sp. 3557_3]TDH21582.1 DUF5009 domain-containing protein [Segetibacter sp. 3557_3]